LSEVDDMNDILASGAATKLTGQKTLTRRSRASGEFEWERQRLVVIADRLKRSADKKELTSVPAARPK